MGIQAWVIEWGAEGRKESDALQQPVEQGWESGGTAVKYLEAEKHLSDLLEQFIVP